MSKNFIEAAILQLRGKGIAHLAAIETIITKPVGVADHTGHVDDIMKHAKAAAECDEAVKLLQMYFVPKPQPAPPPQRPAPPPRPVTPAQSPTLRRAQETQKLQEQVAAKLKAQAEAQAAKPKAPPKRRTRKKKEE
tara:strand:- start:56 stop:463 length:408 start_codon:yes stop_codon:yes gene_type:complete